MTIQPEEFESRLGEFQGIFQQVLDVQRAGLFTCPNKTLSDVGEDETYIGGCNNYEMALLTVMGELADQQGELYDEYVKDEQYTGPEENENEFRRLVVSYGETHDMLNMAVHISLKNRYRKFATLEHVGGVTPRKDFMVVTVPPARPRSSIGGVVVGIEGLEQMMQQMTENQQ
jgi:hypothetical protein